MKEMLKNKAIIGFMILMLGFTYIKTIPNAMLDNNGEKDKDTIIYLNEK